MAKQVTVTVDDPWKDSPPAEFDLSIHGGWGPASSPTIFVCCSSLREYMDGKDYISLEQLAALTTAMINVQNEEIARG